jgi:threonine dehydrogenase-like Zn-dependent dehydrogenase
MTEPYSQAECSDGILALDLTSATPKTIGQDTVADRQLNPNDVDASCSDDVQLVSEAPQQPARPVPPQAVVFVSPRVVVTEPLPSIAGVNPGPGELLVRTEVSAVSAGTEMLVYRGRMPADIPTDSTLGGASGEQAAKPFQYPAKYGYACVGVVHAVGRAVDRLDGREAKRPRVEGAAVGAREELREGMRVFMFREHTSWAVVKVGDVMRVPEGVSARDAAFLPNVETALSLAMDAAPLPGENVAVVGQGIIGLLLVAVLKLCYGQTRVIAVDTLQERLVTSLSCANADATVQVGAEQGYGSAFAAALRGALPAGDAGGVDVAVDVSGTGEGLDTAIRATRDGGRVVIGSWFGAREVSLSCLGGRFHRSHISLVASQVSAIPAPLTARWDKARRFRLAWRLLPSLQPSLRFPVHTVPVSSAPVVYDEIDRGQHLQVLFTY